ncbi:MAG: hypothetical protein Tsb008_02650 [Rhodothalassiaceae bacterium]
MAIIGDGGLSALVPNSGANQQQAAVPRESSANGGAAGRAGGRGDDVVLDLSPEARAVVRPGADAVATAPSTAGAGEREARIERREADNDADDAAAARRAEADDARREGQTLDLRV